MYHWKKDKTSVIFFFKARVPTLAILSALWVMPKLATISMATINSDITASFLSTDVCNDELASKSYQNSTSHQQSTSVVLRLKMNYVSITWKGLTQGEFLDLVSSWDQGICIFNKFPGDVYAAGPCAMLGDPSSSFFWGTLLLSHSLLFFNCHFLLKVTCIISLTSCSRQITITKSIPKI